MAAVTSTLVALGGVGLSAAQAIKANQDMKQAASASDLAKQQLKQIKETNPFKAVQTPMLGFELAQQQQSQREAQMVGALEGAGAEGIIGGIGQVAQAGNEQDMQLAAQANQTQFQRDMAQAEAQQGIEARQAERDWMAGIGDIQMQNAIRTQSEKNRNAAIQGAFSSLGTAALGADKMIDLYKQGKKKSSTDGSKYLPASAQPFQYITGSEINNPNAVMGDQSAIAGLQVPNYWNP
jgi:hypothetical protein